MCCVDLELKIHKKQLSEVNAVVCCSGAEDSGTM